MACSTPLLAGARPASRALISAAIADINSTAAPSSRASGDRLLRGQTIGTPSAVPKPEPARPTNASS